MTIEKPCKFYPSKFSTLMVAKLWAKYYNFEQTIEHNKAMKKELPERKIDQKKAK